MFRLKAALILVILSLAFSASAQDAQVHIVLPGDNLYRIAQAYGVDVDSIARANNITNTWRIDVGQQLIIPSLEAQPTSTAPAAFTAVDEPGTDASLPVIEQPLIEPTTIPLEPLVQPTAQPEAEPTEIHVVVYGEGLATIARNYGMSIDQLAHLNDITNPDLIYAGQKLIVSSDGMPDTTDSSSYPDTLPSNTVTHLVQPGETLASIAQRYGISWLQIAQANNIYDADHVEAGAELLIPGGSVIANADYSFVSAPTAPPARIGVGKEIIVDLSDQRTYAYEDGKLVRNVLSSTGLPATPTVRGEYKVQRKYVAQTMTGPGYYLPDVPYIMYFYAGYALHGTYWHNNFGQPMSHGCVNLPTPEAEWFYNWTELGTIVYVQT